ncbi:MAG: serine hydrolase domain-containing protein [Ktedonobacteraceae bacterium]
MQHDYLPDNGRETVPSEAGAMDPNTLAQIDHYIAENFPTLLSLLIVRRGYLVVERYYNQSRHEDSINIKSVTKSIISTLVGIALHKGYLTSLDQRVEEFFPQYFPPDCDPGKREISLQHLLTLRSGLSWVESSAESLPGLFASDNWVQYGLRLPLLHTPGEVFAYSTLDAHLLSAVLSRATGSSTLAFANAYLFNSSGSKATEWACDPQGYCIGGSELRLTPRDMAKIGNLYLRRGRQAGEQIIPEEYLDTATHTQVFTGIDVIADPNEVFSDTYGYLWWISTVGPYTSFYALGYGGQTIYVIPALDVVLVTTARQDVPRNLGAGLRAFTLARDIAEQFVMPV